MNYINYIFLSFIFIPVVFNLIIILFYYAFNKDISLLFMKISSGIQLISGIIIISMYPSLNLPIIIDLGVFKNSIILYIDEFKIYFLFIYLIPLFYIIIYSNYIYNIYLRVIFLFYCTASSGIIFTGDIFNFFVLYEMMIMSSYIFITLKKDYYAGLRYMFFGGISSLLFLVSIIFIYRFLGGFEYYRLKNIALLDKEIQNLLLIFLTGTFLIKCGVFPLSNWVSRCHSATYAIFSSFLSSWTIFIGIMGFLYFIVIPYINNNKIHQFLRLISIISIIFTSLFILFEDNLKRSIAKSTVYSISFTLLLFSYSYIKEALIYMCIHSLYKPSFFILNEYRLNDNYEITSFSKITLFFLIIMTSGIIFSPAYFLKNYLNLDLLLKIILIITSFINLIGFLKFYKKLIISKLKPCILFEVVIIFMLIIMYIILITNIKTVYSLSNIFISLFELIFIIFIFLFNNKLFNNEKIKDLFTKLISIENKIIYKNFNYELLYVLIMIFFVVLYSKF